MNRATPNASEDEPPLTTLPRVPTPQEEAYMRAGKEPVLSSVLVSSSKYLNSPVYRDAYVQFALRRYGHDLPTTYLIPNMIRALTECRDDAEFLSLVTQERDKRPEFAAWLDRRKLTSYDPANLHGCVPGTLGAHIRAFVEDSGMEMEFQSRDLQINSDVDYIQKRRVACHDIEHMVTGFGPNQLGELALNLVNNSGNAAYFTPKLAKYFNEATMFTSSTSYYRHHLHYPALMPGIFDALRLGITVGQSLRMPLMMVPWEDYLDWQLDDIAADLGFERGPGSAWDYSNQIGIG
jgi:ubiquinone biosynthesis protein COQ4